MVVVAGRWCHSSSHGSLPCPVLGLGQRSLRAKLSSSIRYYRAMSNCERLTRLSVARHARRQREGSGASVSAEMLRLLTPAQLAAWFNAGLCPEDVDVLHGDPVGIALALHRPRSGPFASAARRFAASSRFAWDGKSFRSRGLRTGVGWNRLAVGPLLAGLPFQTSIIPSRLDHRPAVGVRYDAPRVPRPLHRLHDELREVLPGVFVGPSGAIVGGKFVVLCWFAVDTTRQAGSFDSRREAPLRWSP